MTLGALDLHVLPGQREAGQRVTFDGKGSGFKTHFRVAQLAPVAVGFQGEFSAVRFGMAGWAEQLAGLVPGFAAFRLMALRATQRQVFTDQRKRAVNVGLAIEERRLETRCAVTR
jgi:hypothetical protein